MLDRGGKEKKKGLVGLAVRREGIGQQTEEISAVRNQCKFKDKAARFATFPNAPDKSQRVWLEWPKHSLIIAGLEFGARLPP